MLVRSHHSPRQTELEVLNPWDCTLYEAVNKRFLSTGETGELVCGNVGFGLNPGVELAPPRGLLSNWRDRPARKNVQNVADTGAAGHRRCCQDNGRGNLVRGRYGSPQNPVTNGLSLLKLLSLKGRAFVRLAETLPFSCLFALRAISVRKLERLNWRWFRMAGSQFETREHFQVVRPASLAPPHRLEFRTSFGQEPYRTVCFGRSCNGRARMSAPSISCALDRRHAPSAFPGSLATVSSLTLVEDLDGSRLG
jgi:hypothetical protein